MKRIFFMLALFVFISCSDSTDNSVDVESESVLDVITILDGYYDIGSDAEDKDDILTASEDIIDIGVVDSLKDVFEDVLIMDIEYTDDSSSYDILDISSEDISVDVIADVVDAGQPYVKITSPENGATVNNPVTFYFVAKDVISIRFFADNYPLSSPFDPAGKDSFTYNFTGVGYERNILLEGYNKNGDVVASDSIKITVVNENEKGDLIGKMWNTYYYLVYEGDYSGADDTTLYDSNCKAISDVPYKFSDAVCIEGSGKLSDGRVINYAKTCNCGRKCANYNYIVCYSVLDINKYPWGMGSKGNPLVPLRSWAVDNSIIPFGTVIYAEEWDGVLIPDVDGIGNFVHDGCFRADDIGGAIQGMHFDFFAGTTSMWKALEKIFPTKSNFNVYKNTPKCQYLKN